MQRVLRTYSAYDLSAASTVTDHVARTSAHFSTCHASGVTVALTQQPEHRLDAVREDGPAVQHI